MSCRGYSLHFLAASLAIFFSHSRRRRFFKDRQIDRVPSLSENTRATAKPSPPPSFLPCAPLTDLGDLMSRDVDVNGFFLRRSERSSSFQHHPLPPRKSSCSNNSKTTSNQPEDLLLDRTLTHCGKVTVIHTKTRHTHARACPAAIKGWWWKNSSVAFSFTLTLSSLLVA